MYYRTIVSLLELIENKTAPVLSGRFKNLFISDYHHLAADRIKVIIITTRALIP